MPLKVGSNDIGDIYVGSDKIGQIFVGSDLVYSAGDEPVPANRDYILNVTKETRNTYNNSTTYSDKFIGFSVYGGTDGMTVTYDGVTKTVAAGATTTITFGKYLGVDDGTADTGNITFSGTGSVATITTTTAKSTSSRVNCVNSVVQYFGQNMTLGSLAGQTRLTSFNIPSHITSVTSAAFSGCTGLISVKMPSTILQIFDSAFNGCSNLQSIKLGNSLLSISENAFKGCAKIPYFTLPNTLTTINNGAFEGCSSITEITIPNSVTTLGNYAFRKCSSLATVNIGSGIASTANLRMGAGDTTGTDNSIFGGCFSITEINVDSNNQDYSSENGILFNKDKTKLIIYPPKKPNTTTYTIPNTVTTLETYCFYHQTVLQNLTIPSTITALPDQMCGGMVGTLADGGDTLGMVIGSITTLTIPSTITTFWDRCLGTIKTIYYQGTLQQYLAITTTSSIYTTGRNINQEWVCFDLYINNTKVVNVTLTKNYTQLFQGSSIETLVVDSSVTSTATLSFYSCKYLTKVQFMQPDITTLATVGQSSFTDGNANVQYQFADTQANVEAWGQFTGTNFTNTTYYPIS